MMDVNIEALEKIICEPSPWPPFPAACSTGNERTGAMSAGIVNKARTRYVAAPRRAQGPARRAA